MYKTENTSNVKLMLHNCGTNTEIGLFKKSLHDGGKCMRFMNDDLVKGNAGTLPEKTFYYLTFTRSKKQKVWVLFTSEGNKISQADQNICINREGKIHVTNIISKYTLS